MSMALPRRTRRAPTPGIPIAPLVDIVFNLLLFFMLVTHYMQPAIEVQLPASSTAVPAEQASATVAIDAEGKVFFNSALVTDEALARQLGALSPEEVKLIRLQADERIGLKRVVEVLDIIRGSPVKSVALEASEK